MHWPSTPAEAIAVQEELRGLVYSTDVDERPRYVAGLDVAYDGDRLAAAVVVLDWETLAEVDRAVGSARRRSRMCLVCSRSGRFRGCWRRWGACGPRQIYWSAMAKTAYVGTPADPGPCRGDVADLIVDNQVVGAVRTAGAGPHGPVSLARDDARGRPLVSAGVVSGGVGGG
jgi:deoxyribonuclease V